MEGYYLSIVETKLYLSLYESKKPPQNLVFDFSSKSLVDSQIVDMEAFIQEFSTFVVGSIGKILPKLPIVFVTGPENVKLSLVKTGKTSLSLEKPQDVENIDDYYYSYNKISPFIYQLSLVKKTFVSQMEELAGRLGLRVAGIVSWPAVFTKQGVNLNAVYKLNAFDTNWIIFSEFGGVSFAAKYDRTISQNELTKMYKNLSFLGNNTAPVAIYSEEDLQKILQETIVGFSGSIHDVIRFVLSTNPHFLSTYLNLCTLKPKIIEQKRKIGKGTVLAGTFLLVGLVVLCGTALIFGPFPPKSSQTQADSKLDATVNSPTLTPTPTPSPTPEIQRKDLTIKVLNGNGIPGSAGKAKEYLTGYGYNVVEVGNAPKTDYATTQVQVSRTKAIYKDLLLNDLKPKYETTYQETDTPDTSYDVLITVGTK